MHQLIHIMHQLIHISFAVNIGIYGEVNRIFLTTPTVLHSFEFLPALVGLGLTIELAMLFSALVTSVACWEGAGWIWM